jgi:hypothetical protein
LTQGPALECAKAKGRLEMKITDVEGIILRLPERLAVADG